MHKNPFISGIKTGLFLQLAIGPVFFYIVGISIESNFTNSLLAVLAVTIADYIYIALSIIGIGKLLQKERIKRIFGLMSSIILMLFGIMILYKGLSHISRPQQISSLVWTPLNSFVSAFILTISSPLTIVFWSSIFSAKAIENNYRRNALILFGVGAGSATFIFLSLAMGVLAILKTNIPDLMVQIMNCLVGLILIYYGVMRSRTFIKGDSSESEGP